MTMAEQQNNNSNNEGSVQVEPGRLQQLVEYTGGLLKRLQLAAATGMYRTNGLDRRNVWTELGYPQALTLQDYWTMYRRGALAGPIVDAYPNKAWAMPPAVYDTEDEDETPFEEDWRRVTESVNVWNYMKRVDIAAGLGEYAGLLVGFDDGKKLKSPTKGAAKNVIYLQPYDQPHLHIDSTVDEPRDPRFGLPKFYKDGYRSGTPMKIHYSRMVHVANNVLVSDIKGVSALQGVYNALLDIEQVVGAGRESVWRNAIQKLFLNREADTQIQDQAKYDEEVQNFLHGLSRTLDLPGINAKESNVDVADIQSIFDALIALISGRTRIPRRKLLGTETGERASQQDERGWLDEVHNYRVNFCEPTILRQFISLSIDAGVLRPPEEGVKVEWPKLYTEDEETRAKIIKLKTDALALWVKSGTSAVMDFYTYLIKVWEMDPDEARAVIKVQLEGSEEEEREIREGVAAEEETAEV